MATPSGSAPAPLKPDVEASRAKSPPDSALVPAAPEVWTLEQGLYENEGACTFDFFQSIRLLILLGLKDRVLVGADGPPQREIVRFLAHLSLNFPASSIQTLTPASAAQPARMTVNFMGLTGPNGVLPRIYTERLWTDVKSAEKTALQDWLDLFNHRFISLFYRAWEKYRFYLPFERGESTQREPDTFSRCLYSLIGMGFRSHRNRFRVAFAEIRRLGQDSAGERAPREKELARLDDMALLRFGGLFAHRPRCAVSMEMFLQVYLQLPVKVLQFQGQWLHLNRDSQTAAGSKNNRLGQDTLVGDRIWDVQSKVRIRLGPLSYEQFLDFLPDRTPLARRKRIFLLSQLVRYYLGAEMDVEYQLVLQKDEVPATQTGCHSRLGWNTWSRQKPYPKHAEDTVFTIADRLWVNDAETQ
jgi:type VI secretion system protein ImpH